MIGADAHGATEFLALQHQRLELLFDTLQFRPVLVVRVFFVLEPLPVSIVARVDAHFFDMISSTECSIRRKMNVGHQGNVDAAAG